MRVPRWLKIAWMGWLVVWAPVYWRQYGAQNFLYFCDIGNVLIAIGLWLGSALIFPGRLVDCCCFKRSTRLTLRVRC